MKVLLGLTSGIKKFPVHIFITRSEQLWNQMHIIVSTVVEELAHNFLGLPNKGIGTSGKCKCFARWSVLSFTSWQKRGMVPYVGCAKHLAAPNDVPNVVPHIIVARHVKGAIGGLIDPSVNKS